MKNVVIYIFGFLTLCARAQDAQVPVKPLDPVVHVHTAMDHLSVLEFADPVTKVAAGSSGFQIEREGNTVLIKPQKPNASTDLVVWTSTGRYAYELDPPGEVKNMNFAIDAPTKVKPVAPSTTASEIADMVITHTLLGSERIASDTLKSTGGTELRIHQVFRSADSIYVQYTLRNMGNEKIKINAVSAAELARSQKPQVSILGLSHTQLDDQTIKTFAKTSERPLAVVRSERHLDQLEPGEQTIGVLTIRERLASPAMVQITVNLDGGVLPSKATLVF